MLTINNSLCLWSKHLQAAAHVTLSGCSESIEVQVVMAHITAADMCACVIACHKIKKMRVALYKRIMNGACNCM